VSYKEGILHGLLTTLRLVGIAWLGGLVFGTLLGIGTTRFRAWRSLFRAISFFLSSIPVLVFLFWVHYPLQAALNIVINPFITAAGVLTLLNAAAVGEIVRNALDTFDPDYLSAGVVCGLNPGQIFWHVQVPIFLRQVIPSLLRVQVSALHMTLFASLISVDEIFRISQRINAEIYKPIEVFTSLALLFLIISFPLNWLAAGLERRFHGGLAVD
jgi:His/Glu/Gln/Arg/opine family amino acid ABC transporter permease subunit